MKTRQVAALLILGVVHLSAHGTERPLSLTAAEMLQQLDTGDVTGEQFHQWVGVNFERLDRSDAWRVIRKALDSDDPVIVETALMSAAIIVSIDESERSAVPADRIAVLSYAPSAIVRKAAIRALAVLAPDPAGSERQLASRLVEEQDDEVRIEVIKLIGVSGIETPEGEIALSRLAQSGAGRVKHRALLYLLLQPEPPQGVLSHAMETISSPDFFADPNLVQQLPKFGDSVQRYLPQLQALLGVLEEQVATPRPERTFEIFNDEVYLSTLQTVVDQLADRGRPSP